MFLLFFLPYRVFKKNRFRQAPVTMLDGGAFDGAKALGDGNDETVHRE